MSFAEKFKTSLGDLVYLVRGKDRNRDAWHYILVSKLKLSIFLTKIKEGSLDIAHYGQVLHSGWGRNPPEHITEAVKKEYP